MELAWGVPSAPGGGQIAVRFERKIARVDGRCRRRVVARDAAFARAFNLLSHGEKSHIFLARALLQDAQLTILDESFAALAPETLQKCLNCAQRKARTLVVIAHP